MRALRYFIGILVIFLMWRMFSTINGVSHGVGISTMTIIQWIITLFIIYIVFLGGRKNRRRKRTKIENKDNPPPPQEKGESPVVTIDEQYIKTEKALFYDIIRKKIERYQQNPDRVTTSGLRIKKLVLTILLGAITFANSIWFLITFYYFRPIFIEVLAIIIYMALMKNCNTVHYIYKRIKRNPNSNIDTIITDLEMTPFTVKIPNVVLLVLTVIIAVGTAWGFSFLQLGFSPEMMLRMDIF